jgi:hypothetical protein
MVGFRGSTQEPPSRKATASQGNRRFGYRKASNDKKVPDPVGSGCKGILLILLIMLVLDQNSSLFCSVGSEFLYYI